MERPEKDAPHYLIQRVREALAHDPRVGELELRVKMVGDKVFVTGSVPTEKRRGAVSDIVRETLGPKVEVHNEVEVTTFPRGADRETMS
jgi:osmotically-inducible protein OsmY